MSELAIISGEPAFDSLVHIGRPNIGNREAMSQRMAELLDRRWLTNDGPLVREFEKEVARKVGVRHCVMMTNGTIALEIAIRALGMTGEVIIPSYTFIATAHALQWQEITPIFCDIDPATHCIDPTQVEALITPRTSGIIGVHLWGRPCNIDTLASVADRHSLKLLFDASHAFGCSYKQASIGTFGDAEVFSFHATKFLNSFEGGAVCTNDDELAKKMQLMRNFGFQGYDNVVYVGTNGKMTEPCAAMGLTSLESMGDFLAVNQRNYQAYARGLSDIPGLSLLQYDDAEACNKQYIVVEVDEQAAGLSRDEFVAVLWAENVRARRYFWPGCHKMQPYRSLYPHAGMLLPNTERVASRVMVLPTGTAVEPADVEKICGILRLAISQRSALKAGPFSQPLNVGPMAEAFCHPDDMNDG